jgi:hypothetical protein
MKLRRVGPVALLCAITVIFYWKFLLVHQFSLLLGYESTNQAYAWFDYWVATLRTGTFPIWDPFTFSGHAFAGEMQTGAFYPPYLLFLLVPFHKGMLSPQLYHYFYALTHVACAWFMYALVRELGLSKFAGLVSGVCFSFGGFLVRLGGWLHLLESGIWLPLILLLLIRALKAASLLTSLLYCALSGLALSLSILAGGLHLVIMQAIVIVSAAVFYFLQVQVSASNGRQMKWNRVALIAAVTLGFAICGGAVQLLPSAEYSHRAIRFFGGGSGPASERIPYGSLGDALWPETIIGMVVSAFSGSASSGEYVNPYLGVFPLVLAIAGILQGWRIPWVRYFGGLAIAAFLYSLGSFSLLHGILYALVPFISMAREANRFMYLADFALAVLAGYGVDALLSGKSIVSWEAFDRVLQWSAILAALAVAWPAVLGHGDMSPWISLSLLLIVVSYGLYRYLRRGNGGPWARFLILSLILFDLSAFDWSAANKTQEAAKGGDYMEHLRESQGVAQFLRSQSGMFRVDVAADLAPNMGDVFGVEMTRGNAVTILKDYNEMRTNSDLLNVRYVVRPASAKDSGAVYEDSHWKVYENPGFYPRGWLVHETLVESGPGIPAGKPGTLAPDLRRVALVSTPINVTLWPPAADRSDEHVDVRRPNNNRIEADVQAHGQALLVLSELFYPGWRATVNGKTAPILKVDGDLRGIVVPSGPSLVRLYYAPVSFYLGLALSIASVLTLCLLIGLERRRLARLG